LKLASLLAVAAAGTAQWSPPVNLSACPATPAARVVFPSDNPSQATGAGAIVWSASSACTGGAGARVAAIGTGDVPGASAIPRTASGASIAVRGPLLASGAPHGQLVIAGSSPRAPASALLVQGLAGGPFSALPTHAGSAAPAALATAYLGDVAFADPPPGGAHTGALNVHVERFFAHGFDRDVAASGATGTASAGGESAQALTLTLDYRGEALVVWARGGALYARVVPNKGPAHPVRRLARVGAHPRIAAVLSDDDRAIVAWSEQQGTRTSVYIDRSAAGVRFGTPDLLERFTDPDGLAPPARSPSLVRLSSESVMLTWAGAAEGHWVVRIAPVDLNGVLGVSTIATPGADALLADLAPGPADDVLVLWTEPLPNALGLPDTTRQAIFAARGHDAYQGRTVFGEREEVAPPAPVSDASVAVDPSSDRAVAAWQGEGGAIEYSIRDPPPGP
jgi:hypothetical protein